MVGEVFQQSFRNRWIDPKVEFAIPRTRPAPPPEPQRPDDPITDLVNSVLGNILRRLGVN